MKPPSRWIRLSAKRAASKRDKAVGFVALAALVLGYGWLLWKWPVATAGLTVAAFMWVVLQRRRDRQNLSRLRITRANESICTFARTLPIRQLDTWVVRAVFEELQQHLSVVLKCEEFPLRPSDRLIEDLKIDPDDLDLDLLPEIARKSRRDLTNTTGNPYYDKVKTVADLIAFLCAQPAVQQE